MLFLAFAWFQNKGFSLQTWPQSRRQHEGPSASREHRAAPSLQAVASRPPAERGLTCSDDAAQLVQQQLVVPARVQPLLDVAVQLIHYSLHVRILVLQ